MFYQVTVLNLIICCDFSVLLSQDKGPCHSSWRVSEPDVVSGASFAVVGIMDAHPLCGQDITQSSYLFLKL